MPEVWTVLVWNTTKYFVINIIYCNRTPLRTVQVQELDKFWMSLLYLGIKVSRFGEHIFCTWWKSIQSHANIILIYNNNSTDSIQWYLPLKTTKSQWEIDEVLWNMLWKPIALQRTRNTLVRFKSCGNEWIHIRSSSHSTMIHIQCLLTRNSFEEWSNTQTSKYNRW